MQLSNNLKHFLYFTLAFALLVPIGTQTHELGHIAFAKLFGYETELHFASMNYNWQETTAEFNQIYFDNKEAIISGKDFPGKAEYEAATDKFRNESLWVSIGGPLQTCLTGIIGLIMLYVRRQKRALAWQPTDWLAVFLSLFWLREPFNLAHALASSLLSHSGVLMYGGDEEGIARVLGWHPGAVAIPLGIIGGLVGLYVVFKVIPRKLRLSFIIAGLVGSAIGWVFWMNWVGPILLPVPPL